MPSPPRRFKVNRERSVRRSSSPASPQQPQNTVAQFSRLKRKDCRYCNKDHPLRKCFRFRRMSVSERIKIVRKFGYCFNCLAHSHRIKNCKSRERCGICLHEHHTLLHLEANSSRRALHRSSRSNYKQRKQHRPSSRQHSQANNTQTSTVSTSSTGAPTIVINVAAKP